MFTERERERENNMNHDIQMFCEYLPIPCVVYVDLNSMVNI